MSPELHQENSSERQAGRLTWGSAGTGTLSLSGCISGCRLLAGGEVAADLGRDREAGEVQVLKLPGSLEVCVSPAPRLG